MSEPAIPDLATLMGTDPLSLTKTDRAQIIAYYRDNRAKFLTAGKGTSAPKALKVKTVDLNLDVGDIEL